jgi:hypothetical protein
MCAIRGRSPRDHVKPRAMATTDWTLVRGLMTAGVVDAVLRPVPDEPAR